MKPLLFLIAILVLISPAARADEGSGGVGAAETGFLATWSELRPGHATPAGDAENDPIIETLQSTPCVLGGQQTCSEVDVCDDGSPMVETSFVTESGAVLAGGNNCPVDAAEVPAEVTPGLVLQALRRIGLPEADLVIQPPNGRTLVNFETNFYTEQGELSRTVTLLGRQVELRIWPASFRWRFGDGEVEDSTSPGAAYPNLDITHEYQKRGDVAPSVDVTYAAQFRIDGGPWREVAGTVTVPGSPQALRVVEARPVLVGG